MNKKIQIPGIGMRIIKSAIAILLCFAINMLRGESGIVFYSQLAALWCIQAYRSNTKKNALQRTIGTCVGAIFGLIYLLVLKHVDLFQNRMLLFEMIAVPIMIILVLYTTVVLKQNQAAYFSCVVFLSIAVNHVEDVFPFVFVWNRFLDTMIGIAIGMLVNDIRLCFHRDKETLFISGIDDILVNENNEISAFSKVELNRMIDSGMKFTISTMRTPASLLESLRDVNLKYPVVAMDGAVLYDLKKNAYLKVYIISNATSQKIMNMITKYHMNWYANVIIDDTLLIYYGEDQDEINVKMMSELSSSSMRNYIRRPLPEDENVVYFMLFDKTDQIQKFYDAFVGEQLDHDLRITMYPSQEYEGYSYIKIYNQNATKENMIQYLKDMTKSEKVIVCGTRPGHCDVLLKTNNVNEMVRRIRKMYEPVLRVK